MGLCKNKVVITELKDDEVGGVLAVPVADTLSVPMLSGALPAPRTAKDYGRRRRRRCFAPVCCCVLCSYLPAVISITESGMD